MPLPKMHASRLRNFLRRKRSGISKEVLNDKVAYRLAGSSDSKKRINTQKREISSNQPDCGPE